VTNRSDETIELQRIEPINNPALAADGIREFLGPGESFLFRSGVAPRFSDNFNELTWHDCEPVCTDAASGDGFIVFASLSASAEIHRFTILCDTPAVSFTPPPEPQKRHKRKSKGGKGGGNGNGGAKSRSKPKSRAKGRKR
jgi:hypothetical protein